MLLGVLGPLTGPGLRGPRHRAVLARLIVARTRTVPLDTLAADLWDEPPVRAAGTLQTFIGDLRRALEPDRPPRTPPAVLVTEGRGYALRLPVEAVDSWRFETVVTGTPTLAELDEALGWWRGPAYADFTDRPWARAEITRLDELRLLAVEKRAEALLAAGRAAEAVPDLEAIGGPLRERTQALRAEALYRSGRQADALAVLRQARTVLAEEQGLDPGPELRRLETAMLRQSLPLHPGLIGRDDEVAVMHGVRHRPGLVLVTGDAGSGKTALLGAAPSDAVVEDDLHEAGEDRLRALGDLLRTPVLVVAAYRTTDPPPPLTEFLGLAARHDPVRITLGALPLEAVTELVRQTLGYDVAPSLAAVIHRRSGGNPFFVRELARLHHETGDLSTVPPGVRDVLRYRVSRLGAPVRDVLLRAAVAGTDVDVLSEDSLDALETAVRHGLMTEEGPGRFRFAHALVRDALYEEVSRTRRATWHRDIADALRARHPGRVEALAHHYLAAGGPSPEAAFYAQAAAARAEERVAPREAARLWQAALDHSPSASPETRLDLLMGLVRALAISGDLGRARAQRAEALELAGDDPELTARALAGFDVPALWTDSDDPVLAHRLASAARRTLGRVADPAPRCRLLATIALELRSSGGRSGRAAATEALAIARELGDPVLLGLAVNARFLQSFDRAGRSGYRAGLARELLAPEIPVPFRILGRLVGMQAAAAQADFAAADAHAAAADALGDEHRVPLVGVFTQWYAAMRDSISVPAAVAEGRYRAAAARLAGTGMTGLNEVLPLALATVRSAADPAGGLPPRDALFEVRACLRVPAAIAAGDADSMRRLYTALRPAAGELAGAGSGLMTLPPVALYLGDLAAALGTDAAGHYRHALDIAQRAGGDRWVVQLRARVREAL